jgi:tripartite-type tricarboxylate transporter receptor subunit TctC
MRRREFIKMIAGVAAICPLAAWAETYPSRSITMMIPFAPGGSFDVIGRIVAVSMSEILGKSVIVENTSGAAGIIGVKRVASAAPDGYTLLLGSSARTPTTRRSIEGRHITPSLISHRLRYLLSSRWCSLRARTFQWITFAASSNT